MATEAMRGHHPVGLPRKSRTYAEGRVCADPGCETRISVYNRSDRCFLHAGARIPRLRGKKRG